MLATGTWNRVLVLWMCWRALKTRLDFHVDLKKSKTLMCDAVIVRKMCCCVYIKSKMYNYAKGFMVKLSNNLKLVLFLNNNNEENNSCIVDGDVYVLLKMDKRDSKTQSLV